MSIKREMVGRHCRVTTASLTAALLTILPFASSSATGAMTGYGKVDMPNSCAASVQSPLEGALAKLHDFEASAADFRLVYSEDLNCTIALWGAAMSIRGNPLAGTLDDQALHEGRVLLDDAMKRDKGSAEERALIAALDVYFRPYPEGHAARTASYEAAMKRVYEAYPQDPDVAAFYALSLLEAVDLNDTTYTRQRQAGTILEKVWAANPGHPGAPHYLIHAYDYPALALAPGAVRAAELFPKIAPLSSHAQHMPAHIWSMLGEWDKSIEANQKSGLVADRSAARSTTAEDTVYGHAFDFIAYARLQRAEDVQLARDVKAEGAQTPLIVRARFALERDDWDGATKLAVPTDDPFDAAVARFTRALGAARRNDPTLAEAELEKLRALRHAVVQSEGPYWGGLVDIYAGGAEAWIAQATGQADDAWTKMKAAADLDDRQQKHILLENKLIPMRELLGDLAMAQHRFIDAEVAYQGSLRMAPNRYRSILGLAHAASAAGHAEVSSEAYRTLLTLTDKADTERPGLIEARGAMAR